MKQSSATSSNHCFFPRLESLTIHGCNGLAEVASLPPSIKTSKMQKSCIHVRRGPVTGTAQHVRLPKPGILTEWAPSDILILGLQTTVSIQKQLPPSLQQRLDHLEEKKLDPHLLQGNLYLISWFHFNQFNINDQELDCYYIA